MSEAKSLSIPNARATLAIGIFLLVANLANGLYAARGVEPSPIFWWLYALGWIEVMSYWIHADCQRLGIHEPLDLGFFVLLAWPVSYGYHLVKTRGWKTGLVMLGGLLGVYVAGYVFSIVIYFVVRITDALSGLKF